MSSFKKAFQSKEHKERSQLSSRSHLGLLEKHKDYVQRARDFHKKQQRLRVLRSRAEFRNPDEFYHQMENSKITNGRHSSTRNEQFDRDTLHLLKTQDQGYVQYQQSVNKAKIEKIQSSMHIPSSSENKHTIFVDDLESFDLAAHFDTVPQLLDRRFNRPKIETLYNAKLGTESIEQFENEKMKLKMELKSRIDRQQKLQKAQEKMQLQKNLMTRGPRKKVKRFDGENEKTVFIWKEQRKK